jgi:methionine biosynthesis protein MetW
VINQDKPSDKEPVKLEYQVILDLIPHGSRVLDLGCGDGDLLSLLLGRKGVDGMGIEINEQAIYKCVSRGLSVSQQDIDAGLTEYADKSFDYVILNQSLQQVVNMGLVLEESMRVGRKVIVGFPNFAYYKARLQIFITGKTPVTKSLPYMWYDTPNLHFLSISDFIEYCREKKFSIEKAVFLNKNKKVRLFPNLLAQIGIFLLSNGGTS